MYINFDNWLHIIGLSVVSLLACVGLIIITCIFIRIRQRSSFRMEISDCDYYVGCDLKKVNR